MFVFQKILRALLSWYLRFQICHFALLLTQCCESFFHAKHAQNNTQVALEILIWIQKLQVSPYEFHKREYHHTSVISQSL